MLKLQKGYGYWDVTKFPYGGDFKRSKGEIVKLYNEMPIGTYRPNGKFADEITVYFDDHRVGIIKDTALIIE